MFKSKDPHEKSGLEDAIDAVLADMKTHDTTSDEYAACVKQLAKLHKLKEDEKPSRVSPDTLVVAGANLLGIVLVVGHERAHIITSKARDFVLKLR